MKKLVCGCFGTIYYADIRQEGKMSGNRVDVTDDALSAVLSHIMSMKEYDGYSGYEYKTIDGKNVVLCVYDKDEYKVTRKKSEVLTKEQWKQALNELSECPLFSGHYDAEHGSSDFMDGIGSVIECMAYKAEDDSVYDAFLTNRVQSEDKVRW